VAAVGGAGLVGHLQDPGAHGRQGFQPGRWVVVTAPAEGEGVGLDARVEEGDLEGALADRARLADELVEPRFGDRAVALVVDVDAVRGARRLPVEPHAEPHGRPPCCRSHDQMEVAGVEAVGDPPVGSVQHDGLSVNRPVTSNGPMVEPQPRGDSVDLPRTQHRTVGRGEVLGALVAEVVLRRPQAVPVGGSFHPTAIDRDQVLVDAAGAGLGQQLPKDHLGLLVAALAEAVVPNLSLCVDDVQGWPVVVVEGGPDGVVVVDHHRVVDPQLLDGAADVVEVVLEVELGGVHADDHQAVVLVGLGPGAEVGQGAQPVDAGVGPEVDQHDLAAQPGCGQRRGVEPPGRTGQRQQRPFNGQLDRRRVRGRAEELVGSCEERLPLVCLLVHLPLLQ
jgi:hypothetical protein